jgi:hypothetical protein
VLEPSALPNPEAEAEAESRLAPRLLRAKTSDPHINRVFTASGTCPPCGWNARGSQRHGLANVEANTRPQCRAHATLFGQWRPRFACLDWIGCSQSQGSAAACSRLQHVPSAAGSCTGGTRLQHSACGCNTLRCVTPVLGRGRCPGGQQWWRRCRRGTESVAVQMRAGDGLFRGAEVGKGSTQSSCRCGRGVDSAAVASDERSPKCTCGRIGASRTKLRCAHTALICDLLSERKKDNSALRDYSAAGGSTQQTRHSVRRRSARKDSTADCGLCSRQWRRGGSRSRWC